VPNKSFRGFAALTPLVGPAISARRLQGNASFPAATGLPATPTRTIGAASIGVAEKSHSIEFYHEYVNRPNFTDVGLSPIGL
jgi:hypothetical protein